MGYKPYYTGGWKSGEAGGTPITPEALNHMDKGIENVVTYAKKVGTLYNWLDNSYWGNPNEVINQAGVTSAGSWGFLMDRWRANDGGAEVAFWGDGLHFTGSLYQKVADRERFANKPVTIAAKINGKVYCASGTVTYTNEWHRVTSVGGDGADISLVVLGNNELWFQVGNTTNSVGPAFEWAALYEGEYTAETLPEYQPKGYAVELAACGGYVNKNGDTMTGNLTAPACNLRSNNSWFGIDFHSTNGEYRAGITCDTQTKNRLFFRQKNPDLSDQEYFAFTPPTTSGKWYNILTTKDTVTIEQGGTGAKNWWDACHNLGLSPAMNIGTEYTTHERYMDKVVYAKLVSLNLSTSGSKNVHVASGITNVVSIDGVVYAAGIWHPIANYSNGHFLINEQGNLITNDITANGTAYALVKYTK